MKKIMIIMGIVFSTGIVAFLYYIFQDIIKGTIEKILQDFHTKCTIAGTFTSKPQ